MPVSKSKPSNSMELVKQDGNDSLDMLIRRAVGKEPFLSFPRPENGPVQLFQLLHAFDQPELPGWPLLTPLKVQMQKCDKCSREFCSTVNYRRHIRVHRRLRKPDKDASKDRNMLGAFWDKLSADEVKEIVSFKSVMLEEIPGSSVVMALAALIQKPGFTALPQYYLRAGSDLLDIIQARLPRFPVSSQELFSILDDASERTFLCGTASSMQKYVFDGETGKNALEAKNVVACTSFLLEQKLIKAWLTDKDAEALRCQKLLVEEEEAAQRRQAELLERKRRKKLRQKEQRAKDQRNEQKEDAKESESTTSEEQQDAAESSSLSSVASNSEAQRTDALSIEDSLSLEGLEALDTNNGANYETRVTTSNGAHNGGLSSGQNVERRGGRRQMGPSRWLVPAKSQRGMPDGFQANLGSHVPKLGGMQKNGTNRDLRALPSANTTKIWSRKPDNPKTISQETPVVQQDQTKKSEVLIGSISVTLGNSSLEGGHNKIDCSEEDGRTKNVQVKPTSEQSTVKKWRPVSRHGSKVPTPAENADKGIETNVVPRRNEDKNVTLTEEKIIHAHDAQHGSLQFNSREAETFLAQRWKEATSAEHVTLVLSPEAETPSNTQSQSPGTGSTLDSSNGVNARPKFRMKPEKGAKVKYVPKQRTLE